MPKHEMGDRYRWGQHQHGGWWIGTDRLKNRKLEPRPMRLKFDPGNNPLAALARLLECDYIAAQIWETL